MRATPIVYNKLRREITSGGLMEDDVTLEGYEMAEKLVHDAFELLIAMQKKRARLATALDQTLDQMSELHGRLERHVEAMKDEVLV